MNDVLSALDAKIEEARAERELVMKRLHGIDHEIAHLQNMVSREKRRIHAVGRIDA